MAGGSPLNRGEVWWARFAPPDKMRPVVLVSREEAYEQRQYVIVAAVTTRTRHIPAEVRLGRSEGLPHESVANCDDLRTVSRTALLRRVGAIGVDRLPALDAALKFALGLD